MQLEKEIQERIEAKTRDSLLYETLVVYTMRGQTIERVFAGCQREAFYAVYKFKRLGKAEDESSAYLFMHEPEKTGKMEEE